MEFCFQCPGCKVKGICFFQVSGEMCWWHMGPGRNSSISATTDIRVCLFVFHLLQKHWVLDAAKTQDFDWDVLSFY